VLPSRPALGRSAEEILLIAQLVAHDLVSPNWVPDVFLSG